MCPDFPPGVIKVILLYLKVQVRTKQNSVIIYVCGWYNTVLYCYTTYTKKKSAMVLFLPIVEIRLWLFQRD